MLDFNEELAKFQPCADLEEAEENIYGKELEEIKKNKTELYLSLIHISEPTRH